jgi:hypothetical protein
LDIFSIVGKLKAHDEYFEIILKDNKIIHNKNEAIGAYDPSKKTLKISFVKGPKDNPKINGIVVLKGTLDGKKIKKYLIFYIFLIKKILNLLQKKEN